MVLEAERRGCADEVTVIAAALSIQDPRERPSDQTAQADQLHARFADPDSDFIAYLNLWRYLRELQRTLSSNQFRKRCLAEHLHHLRIREWQDLVQQLREAAKDVGVQRNRTPAEPADDPPRAAVRPAVAHRPQGRARARVPGRARRAVRDLPRARGCSRKPPSWVMVAELVETTRLWGRTAARIDPRDVEPLAGHLVQAHLQRAALGRAPRVGGGDRAGDAVRAADRHRPHGRSTAASTPRSRASCSSAARWSRASGRRGTSSSAENARRAGGGRGARAPRAAARHPGRRRGAVRRSSTRGSRTTWSRPRTSTAGGARSGAPTPDLLTYTRERRSSTRQAAAIDERAWPRDLAAGRPRAAISATGSSRARRTTA